MRAGPLDRRITIEREEITQGPDGSPVRGWVTHVEVWASMRDTPGKERYQAPQTLAARTGTMRIRWRSDIEETMRVRYRGDVWQIQGIAEFGRREALELSVARIT